MYFYPMEIRPLTLENSELALTAELMQTVYGQKTRLTASYLHWQYVENPLGPAIGFNAWDGNRLVGHYAIIPVELSGKEYKQLWYWSLNTATRPEYRGKGLFPSLAKKTYELAQQKGASGVLGVANRMSYSVFVQKLGFHSLGALSIYLSIKTTVDNRAYITRNIQEVWKWRSKNHPWQHQRSGVYCCLLKGLPLISKIEGEKTIWGPRLYVALKKPKNRWGFLWPFSWRPSAWEVILLPLKPMEPKFLESIQVELLDSDAF